MPKINPKIELEIDASELTKIEDSFESQMNELKSAIESFKNEIIFELRKYRELIKKLR